MLKKIPFALLLLVGYIVMTLSGITSTLAAQSVQTTALLGSASQAAGYIIALGPLVLAVLVIVHSIKPVVGQVGGIVCLLMAVAYGCRAFNAFHSITQFVDTVEYADAQALYLIQGFLSSLIFALLFWLSGAKIQDEETGGLYAAVGALGSFLIIVLALSGTSVGITPVHAIPTVFLMMATKRLPAVFVPHAVPQGITVKKILIFVIVIVLYYALPATLV